MDEPAKEEKEMQITGEEIKGDFFPLEAWILGLVVDENNRGYAPVCIKIAGFKDFFKTKVEANRAKLLVVFGNNRYICIKKFALTTKGMVILEFMDVVELDDEDKKAMREDLYALIKRISSEHKDQLGADPIFVGMPGTALQIKEFAESMDWAFKLERET